MSSLNSYHFLSLMSSESLNVVLEIIIILLVPCTHVRVKITLMNFKSRFNYNMIQNVFFKSTKQQQTQIVNSVVAIVAVAVAVNVDRPMLNAG